MKLKALIVCSMFACSSSFADEAQPDMRGNGVVRNAVFQQCLHNSGNIDRAEVKNYTDVDEGIDSCAQAAIYIMKASCGTPDQNDKAPCSLEDGIRIVQAMNDIHAVKQ